MAFGQDQTKLYKIMENAKCGLTTLGFDCNGFLDSDHCLHVFQKNGNSICNIPLLEPFITEGHTG
jgi:hypothetical protein